MAKKDIRAFELRADYDDFDRSGGVIALGNGESFHVGKALDNNGRLETDDEFVITALEVYPALKPAEPKGSGGKGGSS